MTAAPLLPEIHLEDQPSAESARAFFQRDRLMAAYALADIDAAEIEKARWWTATRGDEVVACALVVEALPFRPTFASGESEALVAIFQGGIREPRIVVATPPPGRLAVESVYRFERVEKMHRMAVTVSTFRPRVTHGVKRLGPEQLDDVIDLYGHAARTHVRSRLSNIAAVGNVLTRIAYRDRGMATSVTSAVTEAALEQHRDVVLNVRQDNTPAIAVYDRLGYHVHGPFIEGPAVRRSAWGRILGRMK